MLALVLAGCPKPQQPADQDGGTAEAPATSPDTPAGAPPLVTFTLQYEAPADAGLAAIPISPDEKPLIEPTSVLELRSTPGLKNYRVRIFDESERAMVSDDVVEDSAAGLVYRISLPTPLKTGHEYTLVVDAQTGTAITDALGREVEDLRAEFKIAGEKEKPPPPAKPGKKRRR